MQTALALLGGSPFRLSEQQRDWLGGGAYFWEDDPLRAYSWAKEYRSGRPSVVGAAIELGNCLDLTTQRGILAVEEAYNSYLLLQKSRDAPVLENKDVKGRKPGDLALRFLDRAVITHLHETLRDAGVDEYETVRALFPEGEVLYPNAGFLYPDCCQKCQTDPRSVSDTCTRTVELRNSRGDLQRPLNPPVY